MRKNLRGFGEIFELLFDFPLNKGEIKKKNLKNLLLSTHVDRRLGKKRITHLFIGWGFSLYNIKWEYPPLEEGILDYYRQDINEGEEYPLPQEDTLRRTRYVLLREENEEGIKITLLKVI